MRWPFLTKGLRISIEDKRAKKKKRVSTTKVELLNLFSTLNKNKGVINNKIFYFEYEKKDTK